MFPNTVSFSLQSYQISHTIVSVKSIEIVITHLSPTFALCFSHGEEKAEKYNPSCSETRSKIKGLFTHQITLGAAHN